MNPVVKGWQFEFFALRFSVRLALQTLNFCHSCAKFLRKITTDVTDRPDCCGRSDCDREVSSAPIGELRGSIHTVATNGRAETLR